MDRLPVVTFVQGETLSLAEVLLMQAADASISITDSVIPLDNDACCTTYRAARGFWNSQTHGPGQLHAENLIGHQPGESGWLRFHY